MDREEILLERVLRRSRKLAEENGYSFIQPILNYSGCENHDGKEYVVLRNTSELLSVWLVEVGGKLTPVDFEDYPEDLLEEMSA